MQLYKCVIIFLLLLLVAACAPGGYATQQQIHSTVGECKTKECFERKLGKAGYAEWDANGKVYVMSWYTKTGEDKIWRGTNYTGYDGGTNIYCDLIANFDREDRLITWIMMGRKCPYKAGEWHYNPPYDDIETRKRVMN